MPNDSSNTGVYLRIIINGRLHRIEFHWKIITSDCHDLPTSKTIDCECSIDFYFNTGFYSKYGSITNID